MKKLAFALLSLFGLLYGDDFYGDEISTYKGDYYKDNIFGIAPFQKILKNVMILKSHILGLAVQRIEYSILGTKQQRVHTKYFVYGQVRAGVMAQKALYCGQWI